MLCPFTFSPHYIRPIKFNNICTNKTQSWQQSFSLKLLVDKKTNKVLFAEAGKDFVDFLISIMSLPVGTVIRLLSKTKMVGCFSNLYESIENLNDTYMQPNQNKDSILKPQLASNAADVPLLLPNAEANTATYYMCGSYHRHVTDNPSAICPSCRHLMSTKVPYIATEMKAGESVGRGGFVKGVVTYMVMDDLVVTPMSTISGITILGKFNIDNVSALEDNVVELGMDEGLELLKVALQSKSVLTEVFFEEKVRKNSCRTSVAFWWMWKMLWGDLFLFWLGYGLVLFLVWLL